MKMRKLFAILVASALLAALAIVPANAGYVATYTETLTDLGTVTDPAAPIAKAPAAGAGKATATEVVLAVTAGAATIRFTTGGSSSCFQVKVSSDGTYRVCTDNPNYGANGRVVANGQWEDEITVAYYIDIDAEKGTNQVVFVVNGTETVLPLVVNTDASQGAVMPATNINNSTAAYNQCGVFADAAAANITVKSIKFGTVENTLVQSGNKDVTVTVNPSTEVVAPTEYLVDIAFGDFAFTYEVVNYVDDEGNLINAAGDWTATTDTIVVTNNTETTNGDGTVWVTASYAPVADAVPGVTFELDNTAANELAPTEDVTITGTIGGAPEDTENEITAVKLGTITVVVDSANPAA